MPLIARFTVDGWDPAALDFVDDDWAGLVRMHKTYTSGLHGTSVAMFAASGPVEGERAYLAVERITAATDDGRDGAVTIHHGGLESDPATWFGHVVPHSGTGAMTGWRGSARIEHDADGAFLVLDLADPQ